MPVVILNSHHCYYAERNNAREESPVIVLLHGSGGDNTVWNQQIEALAGVCRVIAPDLPGHGQSTGTAAVSAEEYAEWLSQFARSLNLPPFVLAGHSMGGIIAQEFAHLFPDMLQALVLAATSMHLEVPHEYQAMLEQDFEAACRVSAAQAYAAQMPDDMLESGLEMLRRNGPATLRRDLALCNGFDSTPWCGTLSLPCLIICGRQDSITPCSHSQDLARTIAGSTLKTVEASGHMIMQEQPEIFNREIKRFIHETCRPEV